MKDDAAREGEVGSSPTAVAEPDWQLEKSRKRAQTTGIYLSTVP